jgi:hypothetical protein
VLAVGALLALSASAAALDYAPVDRPGPPLSVPRSDLDAALQATAAWAAAGPPVLLIPATAYSAKSDFSWNWIRP